MTASHSSSNKLTGQTSLTRSLVQGIAQAAAEGVSGVREARPATDKWRPVRQWLRLEEADAPIALDPAGTHLTIDVEVAIEYGNPIPALVEKVRRAVARRVLETTGCSVETVNVTVAHISRPESSSGTRRRI